MRNSFIPAAWIILGSMIIAGSCSLEENQEFTYNQIIENGGVFVDPVQEESVLSSDTWTEEKDGITWECTRQTLSIKAGAGGSGGFPLFSPNSSVVYPGNMLQGKSLSQATPDIIAVERAGGVISTDVVDGNIVSLFEVGSISKSEVTEAINSIIAGSTGIVPANFSLTIRNVQSREQFALEVGVDVNTSFTELESKLNFSTDKEYSRFVINLNQSFYTMSFDIPTSLDDLFDPSVSPIDLEKYVGAGNPATYISDVTYGRIYYMLIESTSTSSEMNAAINGSFNGITTKVDGEIEVDYMSSLKDLKIQVFAYGGLSSSSLLTIGNSNLNDLATLLAESSNIGSGKPISYVVRSVFDNQIVSTQLATQYDVVQCKPTGADGAPAFSEHWTGNVVAQLGPVGAAYSYDDKFILINKNGDQYMISSVGQLEGPYSIDDLGTNGPCPFDAIGATVNIDGNADGDRYILVVDGTGTQYTWLTGSDTWSSTIRPISSMAEGTNPFNLAGTGALAFNWVSPDGPSSRFYFNRDGDMFTTYVNNPQDFTSPRHINTFSANYNCPFSAIGAAIGFILGNDRFHIFFDKAGTSYVVYGNVHGTGSNRYLGPFPL